MISPANHHDSTKLIDVVENISDFVDDGMIEEIASGAIVGAVFLVYSMPLVGMAYIQFYVFSGVSGYYLLPEFSETLLMILGLMSIPGAIMGILAVKLAKKENSNSS